MELQSIKLRFGIIGNAASLDRAIRIAMQVATTDLSVLITGESGVGKESFPKIIHHLSPRKHGTYIAVNCGAIPEGTIDSELFGHEKGSFTGAHDSRKGYFEVADGGTIFLDEVAELPVSTQVRLLRVLESGEFMKVGSSKVIKTNVRVVAATNVDILEAINEGKFREDLYYRLNTVPIHVPTLKERGDDVLLLFRKFATDFAEKYRMPVLRLDQESTRVIINYRWNGNVRQLKNITEQMSIIEKERIITKETLIKYLPEGRIRDLPVLYQKNKQSASISERDLLYKVLFDMKKDINELKGVVGDILNNDNFQAEHSEKQSDFLQEKIFDIDNNVDNLKDIQIHHPHDQQDDDYEPYQEPEEVEESLSLQEKEIELIIKALKKHKGKRKNASRDLGISERTLYRKIKEYKLG